MTRKWSRTSECIVPSFWSRCLPCINSGTGEQERGASPARLDLIEQCTLAQRGLRLKVSTLFACRDCGRALCNKRTSIVISRALDSRHRSD